MKSQSLLFLLCFAPLLNCFWFRGEKPNFIYKVMNSSLIASCPRIIAGNYSVGCNGPVYPKGGLIIESPSQFEWNSINNTNSIMFVVVLNATNANFTKDLARARNLTNIVGVVVLNSRTYSSLKIATSDNLLCPNHYPNSSEECHPWNQNTDYGNLFKNYEFPIFYIEDYHSVETIKSVG